jgi:CRISPR/Cas system CMR subunit Cmr6 (Cas7 group RAMP superfamily)
MWFCVFAAEKRKTVGRQAINAGKPADKEIVLRLQPIRAMPLTTAAYIKGIQREKYFSEVFIFSVSLRHLQGALKPN